LGSTYVVACSSIGVLLESMQGRLKQFRGPGVI